MNNGQDTTTPLPLRTLRRGDACVALASRSANEDDAGVAPTRLLRWTAALLLLIAPVVSAQRSSSASDDSKAGLDLLSDDRLLSELAGRGMDTLLERAFEVNQVPPNRRQSIVTLMQLQRLGNPQERLTAAQRTKIIGGLVASIDQIMGAMKDPRLLMQYAASLITYGIDPLVNTLEYWGENPKTRAELRPVAEAVIRVLEKTRTEATAAADKVANSIRTPGDAASKQWEQFDQLASNAEYTRYMVHYDLALALDPADPARKQFAQQAIDYLKQHDNPDSQIQALVRNRLAKLHMAMGDYVKAKELFEPVALAKSEIKPEPNIGQQYEARYFSVLCDVLAGNIAPALKGLEELAAWQTATLPQANAQAVKGAEAAAAMLKYRLQCIQADRAADAKAKDQFNQQARQTLLSLVEQQPGLASIIYDQLLGRLPENPDMAKLNDLELKAMLETGERERLRDEGTPEPRLMERAVLAARELLKRKETPKSLTDSAAIIIPFLLEKLERKGEAASAFLDYLTKPPTPSPQYREVAFDNAGRLIFQLRKENADDSATGELFDRFLPVAINAPFNRREFALVYARRLMLREQYANAVNYFRLVPKDDPHVLDASFLQMLAMKGWLDSDAKLPPAKRQEILGQIQGLANAVRPAAEKKIRSAATQTTQSAVTDEPYRAMLVKTTLLAADIAHKDLDDSRQALEILTGFENTVRGLRDEDELITRALFLRVQCYMATGQAKEATRDILPVLKGKQAAAGATMVFGILKQLDDDLDKAVAKNNANDVRELSEARALLTPELVKWAENNSDPQIKAQTYRYRVFDADSRRRAAQLIPDAAQRRQKLSEALEAYKTLQSPDNFKLYQATVTDKKRANDPDPTVQLGVAMIQYDLENWTEARTILRDLIEKGRLGTGTMEVNDPATSQTKTVDNDIYWEARFKLTDANWRLATAADDAKLKDEIAADLKLLYVKWRDKTGGKRYADAFRRLLHQASPDFQPPSPATQAAGA